MPVYIEDEAKKEEEGSTTSHILTESQANILRNYNRDKSTRNLDDVTRRYVSEHNAVYKGIIYLQSPYHTLATFALVLAFSFDLSGFIFGFVVQNNQKKKESTGVSAISTVGVEGEKKPDISSDWSILKTLKRYIVLTGDYENKDGVYYYNTFRNGLPYQWAVKDVQPYKQGIYEQAATDSMGLPIPWTNQEIRFAQQTDGPRDGVCIDCNIIYNDGSLLSVQSGQDIFLANVEEYLPVHIYIPERGENRTMPVKALTSSKRKVKMAVLALNDKGTRIAAIYMIEEEP